jgi:hypothetical protein
MGWTFTRGDQIELRLGVSERWTRGEVLDDDIHNMPNKVVVGYYVGMLRAYDVMDQADLFPHGYHARQHVPWAKHTVPDSVLGEQCRGCGQPATHKIGDQSGPSNFHELTSYICCECLNSLGMNCALYPPH